MATSTIIKRIKIGITDIFLEDLEPGQGKISITNTYGQNYSTFGGQWVRTLQYRSSF